MPILDFLMKLLYIMIISAKINLFGCFLSEIEEQTVLIDLKENIMKFSKKNKFLMLGKCLKNQLLS